MHHLLRLTRSFRSRCHLDYLALIRSDQLEKTFDLVLSSASPFHCGAKSAAMIPQCVK